MPASRVTPGPNRILDVAISNAISFGIVPRTIPHAPPGELVPEPAGLDREFNPHDNCIGWSLPMAAWLAKLRPRTLEYCPVCRKQTPHEIREGDGVLAAICICCLERAFAYEMDRD